jgi:hypothetical protein
MPLWTCSDASHHSPRNLALRGGALQQPYTWQLADAKSRATANEDYSHSNLRRVHTGILCEFKPVLPDTMLVSEETGRRSLSKRAVRPPECARHMPALLFSLLKNCHWLQYNPPLLRQTCTAPASQTAPSFSRCFDLTELGKGVVQYLSPPAPTPVKSKLLAQFVGCDTWLSQTFSAYGRTCCSLPWKNISGHGL